MNISLIIFDTGEPIDSNQANPNENNRTLSLVFRYDSDLNENNFNFYADERFQNERKNVIVSAIEKHYELVFKTSHSATNVSRLTNEPIEDDGVLWEKLNRQSVLPSTQLVKSTFSPNLRKNFLNRMKIMCKNPKHGHKLNENGSNFLWKTNKTLFLNVLREIHRTVNANALNFDSTLVYLIADAKRSAVTCEIASNEWSNQLSSSQIISSLTSQWACKTRAKGILQGLWAQYMNQCIVDYNWRHLLKSNALRCDNYANVLIVGAGLAGLGAACAINQSNASCSFLILEAQDRIGGRVQSAELLEYPKANGFATKSQPDRNLIETGAQWLHGSHNKLYELSKRYNLLSPEQSDEALGRFLYENNIAIDEFLLKKVDFMIGTILEECERYAQMDFRSRNFVHPASVGAFLRQRFEAFAQSLECPSERKIAWDLFDWHLRFQVIDNSCLTLDRVSAKYWGKYSFNGEAGQAHYNIRDGFTSILAAIVDNLDENCVRLSKHVVNIKFHAEDHTRPRATVACSDGTVYVADHLLMTLPLGVLKANYKTLLEPRLPSQVEEMIANMGFDTINKIFLQFEEAWWGDADGIQFVYDTDDKCDKHWTCDISGFDVLSPGPKNTLLGWIGGKGAMEMENLTDQQIVDDCLKLLSNFTKLTVPAPISYYCTKWTSNEFAKGAYSYISTDCDRNTSIDNVLKEPLFIEDFLQGSSASKSPILLFAGEACHDKYFSTAHGAFLSGIEQVERVLAFYK